MDPTQLLGWIENPKVQANRRRLYATMLGACGTKADAERIGAILANQDLGPEKAEVRSGLDALIACYVTLKGPDGLDLIDELFLNRRGREIPFTETYAAVMALRFLGEESQSVPRNRVLASLRLLLAEPKLADLVIADLARWQDWSVIDRLVELFEKAEADNIFVREPIVNYLRACPLPQAAAAIATLEKIDPEAVRRAATLAAFAGAVGAKPGDTSSAPTATGSGQTGADDGGDGGDGDPGDPSMARASAAAPAGAAPSMPAPPATEAEAAIASRIPAVLADEEATDNAPGIDPLKQQAASPTPPPAAARPPANGGSDIAKWLLGAAVLLLIAVFSWSRLRAAGSGPSDR
jgi:hypothetical protein